MLRKIIISTVLILCMAESRAQAPSIAPTTRTICTGVAFNFVADTSSASGNYVPSNTTYSWDPPTGSGFTGGAGGANQPNIPIALSLTSTSQTTATYLVTPTGNGVSGNPFILTIVINPYATISDISITAANPILCAGLSTTLTATTTTINQPQITWYGNAGFTGTAG